MPKMSVTNTHSAPYGVRADEGHEETGIRWLKPRETAVLNVEDDEIARLKHAPVTFEPVGA